MNQKSQQATTLNKFLLKSMLASLTNICSAFKRNLQIDKCYSIVQMFDLPKAGDKTFKI